MRNQDGRPATSNNSALSKRFMHQPPWTSFLFWSRA
jgi:hypothetical protein